MSNIQLGDKVRCLNTGFKGVVVAKTEFLNGCVQFTIAPKVGKDGKYPEEVCIDEGSLEVISKVKRKIKKDDPGGPTRMGVGIKGF